MARVTVEDCVDKIPNRFELVMMAAHRSRAVSAGAPLTLDRDNDRNPVVALREIAGETIGLDDTRESLIRSLQRHVEVDEPEEEDTDEMMAGAIMAGGEGDSGLSPPTPAAVAAPDKSGGAENPEAAAVVQEADGETGADGPEKSE